MSFPHIGLFERRMGISPLQQPVTKLDRLWEEAAPPLYCFSGKSAETENPRNAAASESIPVAYEWLGMLS